MYELWSSSCWIQNRGNLFWLIELSHSKDSGPANPILSGRNGFFF
ncbi:hypothetical protein CTO_0927 [Chlamydia trachomatis A2497]|uniref:Uncharacterized protein n=1 Tax=Chlamydia trachomatis serovar A (strain A2497) TaxID=580047 RepID=G4NNA7_CHLT4|nr:hypothetical protein CTO_0927 [Chlamydia trachomatis A2497]